VAVLLECEVGTSAGGE